MLTTIRENSTGLIGTAASWVAVITGNQQLLEYWLRVASLACAIVVSILTICSMLKKLRRDR